MKKLPPRDTWFIKTYKDVPKEFKELHIPQDKKISLPIIRFNPDWANNKGYGNTEFILNKERLEKIKLLTPFFSGKFSGYEGIWTIYETHGAKTKEILYYVAYTFPSYEVALDCLLALEDLYNE